jgi:hypothetical protein
MRLPAALCGVCLLVLLTGPAIAATPPPAQLVPGTYRQIDTVTKKRMEVGNQIVVIAGKAGRLGFSINAIRQTDSNQGFIAGVVETALPATWIRTSSSGNCKLTFEHLSPRGLKVTQDAAFGDCGFGYGVSATGSYELVAELPLKT